MTETGSGVVYDGVPLDGVDLRVVDGQIEVRCPMLLRCYRDGTDPKDADGWFPTGDAGAWDETARRLQVFGRRDDVIVTGGEKVWPVTVERVLATHAGVREVAVVGRPDPEWGQRVTALVVPADPADPPTLDELRDATRRDLPAYAAPRELIVATELPRTGSGKLARGRLADAGAGVAPTAAWRPPGRRRRPPGSDR
jgi:O-succinylbenzoic acid--CoA ligase